jgi:4a-hydroxytetrahydrobiopterin dehydratase
LQQLQTTGGAWAIDGNALTTDWAFQNFQQAFIFMSLCAESAERMNHHPDWTNIYNRVHVKLSTHDAGGLTALDFELATAMQAIADKLLDTSSDCEATAVWEVEAHHLVQQWMAAFNQEQLQTISDCYAQDALLWGTHAVQWIHGRDGVTQYFKQVFDSGRQVRVSLSGMQSWQALDCRIAHGSYSFAALSDEGPQVQAARFSFVWQLKASGWQIQSHHSSVMPLHA